MSACRMYIIIVVVVVVVVVVAVVVVVVVCCCQYNHALCLCTAGSPYQFYVDAVDSGVVAAYGPGLSYGVAGEACSFTIDTKNAGAGKY